MKKLDLIKTVYNLESFDAATQYAKANFKDAGGVVLARNLEHVSSEIFTQAYPGLTFLNSGIIVNNEGGYATSVRKLKLKVEGGFRESGSNTQTTGKITLSGEDDSIPVFMMDASSDWSEVELKRSELENINLPSRFLAGHNELYNREIDKIGYVGQVRTDGTQKTTGLLNFAGFASGSATGAVGTLTAQQMYDEIAELITAQWAGVFNVPEYMADRVVMPDTVYNVYASVMLNTANGSSTVLKALQDNFPTVTFMVTTKARSVGGSSRTVAYNSGRQSMQFRAPVPLNISNIHQTGFRYYVESYFGVAGLDVIENTAGQILTGL